MSVGTDPLMYEDDLSVPTSLFYLPTNLYTSVFDFIYVRQPVESPLEGIYERKFVVRHNALPQFHVGVCGGWGWGRVLLIDALNTPGL